jgi:hypothetical protein
MTQQPLKVSGNETVQDGVTNVSLPPEPVFIDSPKPLWLIYAGMLLGSRDTWKPGQQVPEIVYRQNNVRADKQSVAAYRLLCGEGAALRLPPIYPHIMATPLQMNLLESDDFPLNLAGLVHLGQDIEWHAELPLDTGIDMICRIQGPVESARGWEFELLTDALHKGELAWRERLVFLKPDPKKRARPRVKRRGEGDAVHFQPLLHMQFPEDTGRRYARISGDWNPIHLWPFLARRFGFRKPIAHGMYTLARCLSVLEARGVDLVGKRLTATFRAPVMLPAFTNFCLNDREAERHFALTDARKGRILVEGRIEEIRLKAKD